MEIDLIFQIAAIGIIVAVLSKLLEQAKKEDLSMMVNIAGLIVVLLMIIREISGLFDTIKSVFGF